MPSPIPSPTVAPAPATDISATEVLAEVAKAEGRDLGESWTLCALLFVVAVVCLAWSLPAPGISAAFALLCFVLIVREHVRARARFRRKIVRVGVAKGLTEQEAEKAAQALVKAWDASRPRD